MAKKTNLSSPRPSNTVKKQAIPTGSSGISDHGLAALLALLAFAAYVVTIRHGYVLDDDLALKLHENVPRGIAGIYDIFTEPYRANCFGGCLYRPLTLSTFAVEWAIAPGKPLLSHLMNVLWFAATAGLVFLSLRRLLGAEMRGVALFTTLLFLAHPIHTEVVANIKSRDEMLSLFFVILSIHQFAVWNDEKQSRSLFWAALAFLAGLLSKEGAITSALLFPLIAWTFFKHTVGQSLKNSAWVIAPILLFFLFRGAALSGLVAPATSAMDNPMVEAHNWSERLGTSFTVLGKYFQLLVWPHPLISDYTYNTFPLQTLAAPKALFGLISTFAMAALALWQLPRRKALGFAAAAYLISISLYSQIPLVIGTLMGERLLYTPSLWFLLGIAASLAAWFKAGALPEKYSFASISPETKRYLQLGLALSLVLFYLTVNRNFDWKSNFTLFSADVDKAPQSVRLNDGYAEELYRAAIETKPAPSPEERSKMLKRAQNYAQRSLAIRPGVSAYNTMGNVYFTEKDYLNAVEMYQKALETVPNYAIATTNLINTLMAWARQEGEQNNNPVKAREILLEALKFDDKNADIYHLIGISYGVQGNHLKAVNFFEKAAQLNPNNPMIKKDLETARQAVNSRKN